ncbi:MAG: tRNA 2-thiouridine(34) synthase MnmA [Bacteroidia bacterium]|nr:tRNA 2-thiouridine(34) synthase MnmA [Bacteroidia bacterium]MCX7764898.1 tRNA 2-thiouridine(34) synthase MnmA [Bacteroidia bacterium]MDW8058055.1 tRNA 2-thiouridine(34) synthase MnmA [Bacteroidia bacterium]
MRVLVAMSGGVDSSVAAVLLKKAGHEVIGLTMKTWSYESADLPKRKNTGCCNLDDINDARSVGVAYGFPHYVLDLREEFGQAVIEHFVSEYLAGRTPNPCILCNTYIKWDALLRRAKQLGCDAIATGHYARIGQQGGRYFIRRAADLTKDQSYVLWGLSQEVLAQTIFPLGEQTKAQTRLLAAQWGLSRVAEKKDSYEICFIPEGDYRKFLEKKAPDLIESLKGGPIQHVEGYIVGTHEGYPFYTIGQRRGLPALGKPHYVIDIQPETNTIVIGPEEYLHQRVLYMRDIVWHKYPSLPYEGYPVHVKIRHMDPGHTARLFTLSETRLKVVFDVGVKAITPGQAAVAYEGDDLLVGGWIERGESYA